MRGAFTISSYMEGTGTNLRLTQNPPFTPPQVEASNVATGSAYSTESAFSAAAPPAGDPFIGATMLTWGRRRFSRPLLISGTCRSSSKSQRTLPFRSATLGQRTTHLMVPEWLSQGDLQSNGTVTYPLIGGQNPIGTVINGVTTTAVTYGPNGLAT